MAAQKIPENAGSSPSGYGALEQQQDHGRSPNSKNLLDDFDSASAHSELSGDDTMAASKARDPSKPKRKKAKRACAACQRAHLTCSELEILPCHCLNSEFALPLANYQAPTRHY